MDDTTTPDGNPHLLAVIREEIERAGGLISFTDFMALALTHPRFGYYASGQGAPGREGADFLTAPETSPYFGRCIAQQIAECWRLLDRPPRFTVWEYGAGTGTLACTILDSLKEDAADVYAATAYILDDVSGTSLEQARATLGTHADAGHVAGKPPSAPIVGVMLANEFVDALPAHRVRKADGVIEEAYVAWGAARDAFSEVWGPPASRAVACYFAGAGCDLADGQRADICPAAADWIAAVAERLDRGYVITIDYGDTAPALFQPGRFPDGSLMCYFRHTANREPLRRVGMQDITTHVDFSALQRAGAAAGLTTLGLTTQAAFLASLGLGEMLYQATQHASDPVRYINERNAVVRLIEPSAMGRNRVLLQGKRIPTEPRLMGLSELPI